MPRRRRRNPRFPWSDRARAFALLFACALSLLLPAFHFEPGVEPGDPDEGPSAHECSGRFERAPTTDAVHGSCPDGGGCDDPWHHHHSDAPHDVSQCPVCSSLLERISEVPVAFDLAPSRVAHAARPTPRVPPFAERFAIALARGPPSGPSASMDGARGA